MSVAIISQCRTEYSWLFPADLPHESSQMAQLLEGSDKGQADGYAGFDQIYEAGRIQEAACWAHVRRRFYDLVAAHKSQTAAEALERIGALYAIEKEIRGRPPEERREIRNERARRLLESLKQ